MEAVSTGNAALIVIKEMNERWFSAVDAEDGYFSTLSSRAEVKHSRANASTQSRDLVLAGAYTRRRHIPRRPQQIFRLQEWTRERVHSLRSR